MQMYISLLKSRSYFSTSALIKSPGFIHKIAAVWNADAVVPTYTQPGDIIVWKIGK